MSAGVREPEGAVAATAAGDASSQVRAGAQSISARSLVDAALDAAGYRLPPLTRIGRNYQPALLTNMDLVSVQNALTALVVSAAESLEASVRASPSFFPSLDVSTNTEGGVRIRISHNATPRSAELELDGNPRFGVRPPPEVSRVRHLLRAFGGELWTERALPMGVTFVIRFPAAGPR